MNAKKGLSRNLRYEVTRANSGVGRGRILNVSAFSCSTPHNNSVFGFFLYFEDLKPMILDMVIHIYFVLPGRWFEALNVSSVKIVVFYVLRVMGRRKMLLNKVQVSRIIH